MGIVESSHGLGYSTESAESPERYKPDYETIIKRLRQDLEDTQTALSYFTGINNLAINLPGDASIIQMVGALFLRQSSLELRIARAIQEQEQDK